MRPAPVTAAILGAAFSLCSAFGDADPGRELFERHCGVCHVPARPTDFSKLKAPPIQGVMFHIKERFKEKKSATEHIVDFVKHPTPQKALCPSVKRFGLMPAVNLPKSTLETIASYLYENYPKNGFEHLRKWRTPR